MLKHGTKVKVLLNKTVWFLFEVNGEFHFEVMIVFIISEIVLPWGVNYPGGGKLC